MKKRKIIRIAIILAVTGALIGGGSAIYMFNMPHRDVQASEADFTLSNSEIVSEYLANKQDADNKYLAVDGNSKILKITGTISRISENYNEEKVLLLKEESDKAGVSATFTSETNHKVQNLEPGTIVTIKGVIRSGASYDEDLGMYEHVIIEKSDIVSL